MNFLIFLFLWTFKISCSAELSMKKSFITLGPIQLFSAFWFKFLYSPQISDYYHFNTICFDWFFIFQRPYINQSALCIAEKFSLQRTYIIFRTLGLRHLTVVNSRNIVKGIITRKDLMGFSMQEKLSNKVAMDMQLQTNGRVEMNDVVRTSDPVWFRRFNSLTTKTKSRWQNFRLQIFNKVKSKLYHIENLKTRGQTV